MKVRQNDDSHNANDLDVEGHLIKKPSDAMSDMPDINDVQGHAIKHPDDPTNDVADPDGDDTDGHLIKKI